jgi:hypothetical protein
VNELSRRLNLTRSELIAKILEEKLGVDRGEAHRHPTVLRSLGAGGHLKLRSPRFPGRVIK